jgi:hypothetical protein
MAKSRELVPYAGSKYADRIAQATAEIEAANAEAEDLRSARQQAIEDDEPDAVVEQIDKLIRIKEGRAILAGERILIWRGKFERDEADKAEQRKRQRQAAYLKKLTAVEKACRAYDDWIAAGRDVMAAIEKANRAAKSVLAPDEVGQVHRNVLDLVPASNPGAISPFSTEWTTQRGAGYGDIRQVLDRKISLAEYATELRERAEQRIELLNNPEPEEIDEAEQEDEAA